MAHHVTLIRGDGTGPELAAVAREVLDATGVLFEWHEAEAGVDALASHGTPLPDETLASIRATRTCLKAPATTPGGAGFRAVDVALRRAFDLYACVRPCKTYPGVRSRYTGIDLVVVRESTEGLCVGIEFEQGTPAAHELNTTVERLAGVRLRGDAGLALRSVSAFASERIVEAAFEHARAHGRRKVTAVHRADLLKSTDGLFLASARRVARRHPEIEFEDRRVDGLCRDLVQNPQELDVLVLPSLYGEIVGDLCAGLVGGPGVAPGMSLGDEGIAIFETTHGSAPALKDRNKVDPTALLLAGAWMLEHLGEAEAAQRLERAVARVIAEGKQVTCDLKADRNDPSSVGTREMGHAVIAALGMTPEPSRR